MYDTKSRSDSLAQLDPNIRKNQNEEIEVQPVGENEEANQMDALMALERQYQGSMQQMKQEKIEVNTKANRPSLTVENEIAAQRKLEEEQKQAEAEQA